MDNYDSSTHYLRINPGLPALPELLWTGESALCRCGHHIECHDTTLLLVSIWSKNPKDILYHCRSRQSDKECPCKGYTSRREVA